MVIKAWELKGGGKKGRKKDLNKPNEQDRRNKEKMTSTTASTSSRSGSQTRGATDDQAEGDRQKIEENLREKGLE
jgi:hypothetical protein